MGEGIGSTATNNTSIRSMFTNAIKTMNAKIRTLYKKKSATIKAMEPPSLQPNKIDTLCKDKSTEQVSEEPANWFDKSKVLRYEDLQLLTDNFSPDNYMGRTYFGHLYKGIIPQGWKGERSGEPVTIKMWKYEQFLCADSFFRHHPIYIRFRLAQEIKFLQQPDIAMHPYTLNNVMGYCLEDNKLGVVYDLKPFHTLKYYIDNFPENFGWLKRVNVAVKLACLLKFFHEHVPEYIVRNLSPAHVMLDQDLNPVLIDYAIIHGGSLVDPQQRPTFIYGSHGYVSSEDTVVGDPTKRSDIHAYGVILLEMMRQITFRNDVEAKSIPYWTEGLASVDYLHYKKMQEEKSDGSGAAVEDDNSYSYAHESMKKDTDYDARDGNKLSMLGLRCVEKLGPPILSMDRVLGILKELKIVESHPELLLDDEGH